MLPIWWNLCEDFFHSVKHIDAHNYCKSQSGGLPFQLYLQEGRWSLCLGGRWAAVWSLDLWRCWCWTSRPLLTCWHRNRSNVSPLQTDEHKNRHTGFQHAQSQFWCFFCSVFLVFVFLFFFSVDLKQQFESSPFCPRSRLWCWCCRPMMPASLRSWWGRPLYWTDPGRFSPRLPHLSKQEQCSREAAVLKRCEQTWRLLQTNWDGRRLYSDFTVSAAFSCAALAFGQDSHNKGRIQVAFTDRLFHRFIKCQ